MDSTNYQKLLGLHRAAFQKCQAYQGRALLIQLGVTILACIAILITDEAYLYGITLIAFVCTLGWNILLWQCRKRRAFAERSRRALLLIDGLGTAISRKEYTDLLCNLSLASAKEHEDPNYFATTQARGYGRLASMLQESAFWTQHLLSECAKRFWIIFFISLVISIVLLLAAVPFLPNEGLSSFAKVVCVLLTLIISNDILGRALDYSDAAHAISDVDQRLEAYLKSNTDQNDLHFILGDYNSAVEAAPVVCGGVYEKNKGRLTELWNIRTKSN